MTTQMQLETLSHLKHRTLLLKITVSLKMCRDLIKRLVEKHDLILLKSNLLFFPRLFCQSISATKTTLGGLKIK